VFGTPPPCGCVSGRNRSRKTSLKRDRRKGGGSDDDVASDDDEFFDRTKATGPKKCVHPAPNQPAFRLQCRQWGFSSCPPPTIAPHQRSRPSPFSIPRPCGRRLKAGAPAGGTAGAGGVSGSSGPGEPLTLAKLQAKLEATVADIALAEQGLAEEKERQAVLTAAVATSAGADAGSDSSGAGAAGEDDLDSFMKANEAQRIDNNTAVRVRRGGGGGGGFCLSRSAVVSAPCVCVRVCLRVCLCVCYSLQSSLVERPLMAAQSVCACVCLCFLYSCSNSCTNF
jgi:hypothetical protein